MSDQLLDAKLRAFLEDTERDRADGNTIANVRLEQHQMRLDINELGAEVRIQRLRLDRHGKKIRELERHVFQRDDDMDTGVHQVEDLRKHLAAKENELKERRSDSVWWRRQKVTWIVAASGTLALMFFTAFGTIVWFLLKQVLAK